MYLYIVNSDWVSSLSSPQSNSVVYWSFRYMSLRSWYWSGVLLQVDHWQRASNLTWVSRTFQVKCTTLRGPGRWPWRRQRKSARRGTLCWRPRASSTPPGGKAWTNVTMAGSLTAVPATPWLYPECNAAEACWVSEPCIATKTKPASRTLLRSWELTVLEVQWLQFLIFLCDTFEVSWNRPG